MRSCQRLAIAVVVCLATLSISTTALEATTADEGCSDGFVRSSIAGEGNRVKLTLGGQSPSCSQSSVQDIGLEPQPYFTYEVACSTDRQAAVDGVCSTTPCPDFGRFFAFRTIHRPDGSSGPAGFRCVTLDQAVATPGVTLAEVFEAIRRIKLPGGQIGVEPRVRGLANLTSYFWVQGATQSPVNLQVGDSRVQARFRVVEYHWDFGAGEPLVTTGPGSPGLDSEVRTAFPRRGRYRVGVQVLWVAEAWLDGRRVGQVEDLVSQAQTTYPVAELQTTLTG